MNKINWINGQAGGTPLSAENLNQMQDNIEEAINDVDKKLNYSTEEKVVGTWIDGEPIYRKVYYLTYSSQRIDDNINIGFDNWDKVITLRGLVLSNNDHSMFPIPGIRYYHGTLGGLQLSIVNKDSDWRPNTIYIYGETFEIDRCVIIFEYTKTTD